MRRINPASFPLLRRRRRKGAVLGSPDFGSGDFVTPWSLDRWRCRYPRVDGGMAPPFVHGGVFVLPPRRHLAVAFSSGVLGGGRWCVGVDDGGLGSGVRLASEDMECCELGVCRRPRFGSTKISTSSEVVTVAALNACGLGAPATPCREVEDGGLLVWRHLYLASLSGSPRSRRRDLCQWPLPTRRCSPRRKTSDDDEEEEEECRICRLPAEPARPLRHPCACRGSISSVHDDCQLQWIATRHGQRCEVCKRDISIRLLYAADAPSRLPAYEFMVGLPNKLVCLLLPLGFVLFAVCVVPEFVIHLTNLWAWRLVLARSFGQVHYLLSLRLSAASVLALFAILVGVEHWTEVFNVTPFARWVDRLETRLMEFGEFDGLPVLALYAIELFLMVVIFDLGLACVLGFLPFSLGRIIISCSDFLFGDEVHTDTSKVYVLLLGYGVIIFSGVISAMLTTFGQYLRGKPLTIAIFIRRSSGIFLTGIVGLIDFANFCLTVLNAAMYPLLVCWWLDIWASKVVGATMSQRFKLLYASPFASTALQWLVGHTFSYLYTRLFILHHKILRPGVAIPSLYNIDEPFYKLYFKKRILVGVTFVPVVISVSIHIADRLAPELFPLDIIYFSHPAKGLSFWQAPRNYADSLCRVLLLRFLMNETDILVYVEWLVKKVTQYSFATSVVLSWMIVVIFNSAVLIFPISIGRALLSAITRLPLACGLKSNDLLAFVVGFSIMSTIIAASRDSFAYITCGRARLLALNRTLVKFLWVVIVPLLIGSLVDLLLIPLLAGPDDDVSVFYIWYMGFVLLRIWLNLVRRTRDMPFLAYFIDERWDLKIVRFRDDYLSGAISLCWFFQDIFMPIASKLLVALGVPYVLAKGVFPRFGYSAAVNSAVYRLAWLGILGLGALCYLAKVFWVELHGSIRDDLYLIGKRVEDVADKRDRSSDIKSYRTNMKECTSHVT